MLGRKLHLSSVAVFPNERGFKQSKLSPIEILVEYGGAQRVVGIDTLRRQHE